MADGSRSPDDMNLAAWNVLRPVDRKFTKPITGKTYKGDSPNPTYIIMKLTELFGPIGQRWGFEVKFDRVRPGAPHRVLVAQSETRTTPDAQGIQHVLSRSATHDIIREEHHEVCIDFWQVSVDGSRRVYSSYGGTPMLYMSKAGKWVHDEDAAKKSLTDAYTKAASWLGACADIFLGIFDDKYSSQTHDPGRPGLDAFQGAHTGENGPYAAPVREPGDDSWGNSPVLSSAPHATRTNTADAGW